MDSQSVSILACSQSSLTPNPSAYDPTEGVILTYSVLFSISSVNAINPFCFSTPSSEYPFIHIVMYLTFRVEG